MSQQRLTDRSLAPYITGDTLIHIVNTGDPSQYFAGSSYKATIDQVANYINQGITTESYWTSGSSGTDSVVIINSSGLDATANRALAWGNQTLASGSDSTASGFETQATGSTSTAQGYQTVAGGSRAHAEGFQSRAMGNNSHAEGNASEANGNTSHAEGWISIANGDFSHAEGWITRADGGRSHSQGHLTIASGDYSHAGGYSSIASGETSFIHSTNSVVTGARSVLLGGQNLTGTTDDTVYVPYLNINILPFDATPTNLLGVDTNGGVVSTTVISSDTFVTGGTYSAGTATFTNNNGDTFDVTGFTQPFSGGSGNCITDLFVSNIHSCSPLNINPLDEGNVYFGSTSGVTIDLSNNRVGIGESNPDRRLVVSGSKATLYVDTDEQDPLAAIIPGNRIFFEGNPSGSTRMVFGTEANVGVTIGQLGSLADSGNLILGNPLDTFIYSNNQANNLNIITQSGSGTDDNIRFYAGSTAVSAGPLLSGITSAMHIQGSGPTKGYIGINNENPTERLDVSGKTKTINFQMTSGGTTGYVLSSIDNNGNSQWGNLSSLYTGNTSGTCITDLYVTNLYGCSPLHIEPSGLNDVYIVENGGNVGIGTTSPGGLLELYTSDNNSSINNRLRFRNNDAIVTGGGIEEFIGLMDFYGNENQGDGVRAYIGTVQDSDAQTSIIFGTTGAASGITLNPTAIGGFPSEAMRIDPTGRISIGLGQVDDIDAKLHINNTTSDYTFLAEDSTNPDTTPFLINSGGTTSIGTEKIYRATPGGTETKFQTSIGDSGLPFSGLPISTTAIFESNTSNNIGLISPDNSVNQIYFGTPSDAFGAYLRWDYTNRDFILSTGNVSGKTIFQTANGVEAARIDENGNFGIGTNTPQFTLDVAGETRMSGNGQNILTIIGSGDTQPLFTVVGDSGELFSITDSLVGELFSVNDASGLPILRVFDDNTVLMGSNQAPSLNTTVVTNPGTGLSTVYSLPMSAYTGAWYEYTVSNTGGVRAGSIMSVFSGNTAVLNEYSTTDIGNTSDIQFSVSADTTNAYLQVSATTTGWEVKTIIRSI